MSILSRSANGDLGLGDEGRPLVVCSTQTESNLVILPVQMKYGKT